MGVVSPDVSGAGDECCDAMFRRKLRDYAELEHEGVAYKPMVFSAFGRAHPKRRGHW